MNGIELPGKPYQDFFDHCFATHVSLPQVGYSAHNQGVNKPDLVIYDADSIDCTQLTDLEEGSMAMDLRRRAMECRSIFRAPILLTLGMPGVDDPDREDARPGLQLRNSRAASCHLVARPWQRR